MLLFIGAMGKSAQLFLHTWLPDAMEGPTPVSALIHAATMVTAGVFLVCRMSPILEWAPYALTFITVIGASTAFFAATVGLVQNDIKRVIAYSTCSQLGYMFVAAGVGAYPAAMFHLFTHAFFKALLFLCAGSVIHAMHHEQDMRNYGGLRKKIPLTFWTMLIGTLAITGVGIPLTAYRLRRLPVEGRDHRERLGRAERRGAATPSVLLVLSALMTSFYSWRLIFMTFFGAPRGDHHAHDHAHESPRTMLIPLAVLAVGSVLAGMIWYKPFFGDHASVNAFFGIPPMPRPRRAVEPARRPRVAPSADRAVPAEHGGRSEAATAGHARCRRGRRCSSWPDNHVIDDAHHAPAWVKASPFVAMLIGLAVAYWFYIARSDTADGARPTTSRCSTGSCSTSGISTSSTTLIFVRPARWLGTFLWKKGDGGDHRRRPQRRSPWGSCPG